MIAAEKRLDISSAKKIHKPYNLNLKHTNATM